MPIVRRRQPGFGVESIQSARARDLRERWERTRDINWTSQAEMDEIVEKKRKAEEEEPYNRAEVRSKQRRLVAQEVARRSMLQGVGSEDTDIGFALPSSTSSAEELERVRQASEEGVEQTAVVPVDAEEENGADEIPAEVAEETT
ncbi:hypothetical protein B0A55_09877, partial [Friedmanniomyces simplex]